jgi:hypothetical protein
MAELKPLAAGYSVAVVSAVGMLLLGILGNLGLYLGAVAAMQKWHVFFSLSVTGIVAGIVEAAVSGFVVAYAVIYLYNKLS